MQERNVGTKARRRALAGRGPQWELSCLRATRSRVRGSASGAQAELEPDGGWAGWEMLPRFLGLQGKEGRT